MDSLSSCRASKVPGLDPSSKDGGNLEDIKLAGSFHQFLMKLHHDFGPIASFWWGPTYTVSICEEELFRQHQTLFDRPVELFMAFEPILTMKSIQYANGTEGRARRKQYDVAFTHGACQKYFSQFQDVANEIIQKWDISTPVPVCQQMSLYTLKAAFLALHGKPKDDQTIVEFKHYYDKVWSELELRLTVPATEEREQEVRRNVMRLRAVTDASVRERKENPPKHGEELLLDLLIDYTDDDGIIFSDALGFSFAGFHTTGNLLSWGFYYLAANPEVQERLYLEISDKLHGEDVDHTNMPELVYLRQVLDESLRCAVIAPWAARYADVDSQLAGYTIPKHTPVVHALGACSKNAKFYPEPDKFDPDRFSPEVAKGRRNLAFVPFGFAGGRKCPAHRFAYAEASVMMVTVIRKFKLLLTEGRAIEPVYGLVTKPNREILLKFTRR